jgi:arylsulfatase A-like enzyme
MLRSMPGIVVLVGCLCLGSFSAAGAPPAKPNVIFILTDDLGYGDLGALYQKNRQFAANPREPWEKTPHLDLFAAGGVRMLQHYCPAPVCAPSRASLMLGVTQGHANVRDNQFDKALEDNHTLATVLRQGGYETVAIGKWGLQGVGPGENNPATWPAYPTRRGFDYFFGYARHKDGHEHYPKEGLYDGPKQVWDGTQNISEELDKCYTADLWTARAKKWIQDHERTNSAEPFFMYLAFDTPHAVLEYPAAPFPAGGGIKGGLQWLGTPGHMINTADGKPDSYVYPDYAAATWDDGTNSRAPWPDIYKRYATSVRRIDDCVGDLLQLLADLRIDSNTFIVFTSDNGPSIESYVPGEPVKPTFFHSFGPFDGIKRDCWEAGVRMPTLARWPGHIPAGSVNNLPSGFWDWMPTFAALAGVTGPARSDGVSLLPSLTGTSGQRTPAVYVEYYESGRTPKFSEFAPAHRGRLRDQMQLIRFGDDVGVRYHITAQSDDFEIYNVVADPQERTNLAREPGFAAMEKRMKEAALQRHRPNSSAPRPYDNELMAAADAPAVSPGVDWKVYEGSFPWVPDLTALTPTTAGATNLPTLSVRPREDDFGILFSGFIEAPTNGNYTFYLKCDAGALLRVHEATVIDEDFGYRGGSERSGAILLKAGKHPFRLYYSRRTKGIPELKWDWSGPGIPRQSVPASALFRPGIAMQ